MAFEELLSFADQQFPSNYDPTAKITDFRLRNVLPGLRHLIAELKIFLETKANDPKLCGLTIKSMLGILRPRKLSDADAKYLLNLIHEIESIRHLDQQKN